MSIKTYEEALSYLSPHEKVSKHYNLDTIRKVCEKLWNPQNSYKIIHIAWTNWKGSTSQMCFSIIKNREKKVGMFTSPHIVDIRERFQTNIWKIKEKDFINIVNIIKETNIELSFFEKCCILWFIYFKKEWCEYAIIETWLWWLLDSTNIVNPTITTITSIWYDHMNVLWNTLEEISYQKAWIIKTWIPIVINMHNNTIQKRAQEIWSPIIFTNKKIKSNLLWEHQKKNAGLAYEICHYLWTSDQTIYEWLERVSHPWRLEFLLPNLLIDWAHNKQWLQSLKNYIKKIKNNYDKIIYCFSTKQWKEKEIRTNIIKRFWIENSYIIVEYEHYLLANIKEIKNVCSNINYEIKTPKQITNLAKKNHNNLYIVFWSLYMIGWFYNNYNTNNEK